MFHLGNAGQTVEENIDDISRQISMAFIKDTVYKQLSNLKPENVLFPRN